MVVIAGNSLVHQDIRADNLLLTPDRGELLVDWPHACRGAPWLDAVLLLINVRLYGGTSARNSTNLLERVCAVHAVPLADAIAVLTASLGYFLDAARMPPSPGLPTVRSFQQAQADALLGWLPELAD